MSIRAFVLVVALAGGTASCSAHPPGCTPEDLAKIEAAYQAELATACMGQGVDCPARPAISAKYHQKRQEWVTCSQ